MNNEVTTHETTAQEFDMTKTATESPRIIAHEFDEVLAEVFNAAAFEDTDAMSDACDVLGVLGLSKYTMFEISGADKESQRHVHRSTKSLRKLVEKYVYCGIAGNPDAPVVHRRSVMMTIKGPSGLVRLCTRGPVDLPLVEAFYDAAIDVFKASGGSVNADIVNAKINEKMGEARPGYMTKWVQRIGPKVVVNR